MNIADNNIEKLRKEIDSIDQEIIDLIIKRTGIAREVINNKLQSNNNIFNNDRENAVIHSIKKQLPANINHRLIEKVYKSLMELSKDSFLNVTGSLREVLNNRPIIIAGPCAIESKEQAETIAKELKNLGIKLFRGGTYKARTTVDSFQGLGDKGVEILKDYTNKYDMFSVSELLETDQVSKHINDVDVIQIGSRNMTSFGLLKYLGKVTAESKKPIILKRGLSSTLNEFIEASKYITQYGNDNIIFCLRGIRTFEQIDSNLRNTPDLASILELKEKTDKPIIFDSSHSTGNSRYVCETALAAMELGADGLMIEVHNEPESALSDGQQSIKPSELEKILRHL